MRGSPRVCPPPGASTMRHSGGRRGRAPPGPVRVVGDWQVWGGGIPEEVADEPGQSAHLGWGGVGQQGHHQSP